MKLTEQELAALIKASEGMGGQYLSCRYGPGWVDLDERVLTNQWAVELVNEMREQSTDISEVDHE